MSAHIATPPRPSGLTLTATHRATLARINRGEPLTRDCAEVLGELYLHELVEDIAVSGQPFRLPGLTSLGRRVLDVHSDVTRRTERPRLVSRPMPARWSLRYVRREGPAVYDNSNGGNYADYLDRTEARTMARDLLALIDWLDHEDAVRAQDGGS